MTNNVFADTCFWIALVNPNDQHYQRARQAQLRHKESNILSTESVIIEFFNFYSESGKFMRQKTHEYYEQLRRVRQVEIVGQTAEQLKQAILLHSNRLDKGYSLTDCISMTVMKERNCNEALTNDKRFSQEGFTILM
jgi:uncharacterized protein